MLLPGFIKAVSPTGAKEWLWDSMTTSTFSLVARPRPNISRFANGFRSLNKLLFASSNANSENRGGWGGVLSQMLGIRDECNQRSSRVGSAMQVFLGLRAVLFAAS